ncbi:hypothetical protein ABF87_11760 [Nitrosomonas sp. JL21]|uniref:hypothetical protein n=1 Tax=Nitrosomonas sp. JL21 TaxID=153949 RepID=UPI001369FC43|nr:hypothetical protein [Nitrosomonas sp. JL21]MXS78617.1 hypothetical protein [Nitrosomonas sp. JL21]
MAFIAESITTYYDGQQDRLNLLFVNKEKKQLVGVMVRRLLKNLLSQLPEWLALLHHGNSLPQTAEQQWHIRHLHHQVSQQTIAVTYGKVQFHEQFESFLIDTIHFAKGNRKTEDVTIKLAFLNSAKTTEVIFILTIPQLHKLLGEILKQVKTWDIHNPWEEKNANPTLSTTKPEILH